MTNNAEVNYWKDYKATQQQRRNKRLPVRIGALLSLEKQGFTVKKITSRHYRINGRLDVWPLHSRYHDLQLDARGGFKSTTAYDIRKFIKNYFKQYGKYGNEAARPGKSKTG